VKLIGEIKKEEARDAFTLSAFTAFQMGAGGEKKFGEYLNDLGLSENTDTAGAGVEVQVTKEEALKKAEAILKMVKNKGNK